MYGEEKPLHLKKQRGEQAVALAMQGRWREAIELNKSIIEDFSQEVNAYNRLGRAYMELGDYAQAREAYGRAVEVDPHNAIARKNLHRLSYVKEPVGAESEPEKVEPQHFIEEIGKAGVVNLSALAPWEIRALMVAGDRVYLRPEGTNLLAESGRGEYLGQVKFRHAQRLVRLMEGGNRYTTAVVSSEEESMTVIIREIYQDPSQAGRLSFPPKGTDAAQPFTTDRVLRMEVEFERKGEEGSGYTIIGGDEIEVLPEETGDADEDAVSEEE